MKKLNYQKIKFKLKYIGIIFIPIIIIGIWILFAIKTKNSEENLKKITSIEKIEVEKIHNILLSDIIGVTSDLMYLSQNPQLDKYLNDELVNLDTVEKDFLLFSKNKKLYGQIRYLDEKGREKIRINYKNNQTHVVPKNELQDKSDRYYFKDSVILEKNHIFLSDFDLNKENGKIEVPLNPTLRFATPVFNSDGDNKGIIIINYFGEKLLNNINKKLRNDGSSFLINNYSYYLKSDEKNKEWGFMFKEKQDINFKNEYPKIWEQTQNNDFGKVFENNILFTYSKIYPNIRSDKNYYWIVFTKSDLSKYEYENNIDFFQRILLLTAIALLLSVMYSNSKYSEYEHSRILTEKNKELFHNSTIDKLTDIYNRNHLIVLFEKEFSKSLRHNLDLICLIIDLDSFKMVNDTYGHLTGDYVLKTVAKLVKENIRNEDIFGRYGGDEFFLILPQTSLDEGKKVAEKIKNKIKEYTFKTKDITFNISFSVGISKLDPSMKTIDDLIEKADISLYESKERRKRLLLLKKS